MARQLVLAHEADDEGESVAHDAGAFPDMVSGKAPRAREGQRALLYRGVLQDQLGKQLWLRVF
jgi:hypothetical protein